MMQDPPETSELVAFVSAIDAGSLSGAARELRVPRATVSRRLARLEERLGVRLLHRNTRSLALTEAGAELHVHARAIVSAVDAASSAVRRGDEQPRGLLRIAVPPSGDGRFSELFLGFLERFPEVSLEIISSTLHEDLVSRGIDVALRASQRLDPGLIARRLSTTELIGAAAPAYLERAGIPRDVEALADHTCLVGFERGERPATHWPLRDGGQIRIVGRLACNDLRLLVDAAIGGHGVALLPRLLCGEALASGQLVQVLADQLGIGSQLALVYPDRRFLKPAVRAFVDHAVAWVARSLPHDPGAGAQGPC